MVDKAERNSVSISCLFVRRIYSAETSLREELLRGLYQME